MAAPLAVTPDTPITIKLQHGSENKRVKLPLKDLVPGVLPAKLRTVLGLREDQEYIFERFSDSAGSFVKLDESNAGVFKQLHRAAKAKLKLRIKVTPVTPVAAPEPVAPVPTIDPSSLNMAGLSLASNPIGHNWQPSFTGGVYDTQHVTASAAAEPLQELERQKASVARQLSGLHTYLNDFRDNMAQDYSAAFGSQLPSFLDVPAEPDMPTYPTPPFNAFSVCCNQCNFAIPDHHWHCGVCNEGDFDLCQQCLDAGHHCNVPEHYLVRRTLEGGKIISSTTETASRPSPKLESKPQPEDITQQPPSVLANEVPGAFSRIQDDFACFPTSESRTCNSCISIYDDSNFVTCKDCDDYDLCIPCHVDGNHGHHPGHTLAPAIPDMVLEDTAAMACEPGRNYRHNAVCDGCDQPIFGVRHKCLDCPDWDYCSNCHKSAELIHTGHRFAPVYGALQVSRGKSAVHYGIRCDGPLCSGGRWIVGDRYKCAICHDTDFCANCEALPANTHNRTHPLIKFRTPIRNVNVTIHEEEPENGTVQTYGDRMPQTSSRGTETISITSANASTQAEAPAPALPKSEPVSEPRPENHEVAPTNVHVEHAGADLTEKSASSHTPALPDAYYVRDYVPDGTKVLPNKPIYQTWTMYNPSGVQWPVGCSLRWVGGDAMLDVDTTVPGSISLYENAAKSNSTKQVINRGQEYAFSVKMRSPDRLGRAVSYWRLYTPDGQPFGHRLWCDVEVVADFGDIEEPRVELKSEATAKPEVKPQPAKEQSKELSESQMVFPKLEKESPASSTHLVVSQVASAVVSTSAAEAVVDEAEELLSHDDVESVTVDLDDDETTDDGFLTDEEYEMVEEDTHH